MTEQELLNHIEDEIRRVAPFFDAFSVVDFYDDYTPVENLGVQEVHSPFKNTGRLTVEINVIAQMLDKPITMKIIIPEKFRGLLTHEASKKTI